MICCDVIECPGGGEGRWGGRGGGSEGGRGDGDGDGGQGREEGERRGGGWGIELRFILKPSARALQKSRRRVIPKE